MEQTAETKEEKTHILFRSSIGDIVMIGENMISNYDNMNMNQNRKY